MNKKLFLSAALLFGFIMTIEAQSKNDLPSQPPPPPKPPKINLVIISPPEDFQLPELPPPPPEPPRSGRIKLIGPPPEVPKLPPPPPPRID